MPTIRRQINAAGSGYMSPFVGPAEHPVQIPVNIANLTAFEVDSNGYIVPGTPLTVAGALVGTAATGGTSTAGAATAENANVGNGTVGTITGSVGGPSEIITLRATSATNFDVTGSQTGYIGNATVGTPFVNAHINLTITAGGTAFAVGDRFDILLTAAAVGGTNSLVFGVVPESVRVAASNATADMTAAGTVDLAVIVIGVINRHIAEANLGRAYTAAELAGFGPGCRVIMAQ